MIYSQYHYLNLKRIIAGPGSNRYIIYFICTLVIHRNMNQCDLNAFITHILYQYNIVLTFLK